MTCGPCGWLHLSDWPCERCAWLSDLGRIVGIVWMAYDVLGGLDAVAGLLRAHARERAQFRAHRLEANQEIQRSATEAYNAGLADAQERMGL